MRVCHRASACARAQPGGVITHDLSSTDFEVVDEFLNDDETLNDENDEEVLPCGPSSPRRKWLLRQEVSAGSPLYELSNASIGSPAAAGGLQSGGQRGRAAMRRVREKAAGLLGTPFSSKLRKTMDGMNVGQRI